MSLSPFLSNLSTHPSLDNIDQNHAQQGGESGSNADIPASKRRRVDTGLAQLCLKGAQKGFAEGHLTNVFQFLVRRLLIDQHAKNEETVAAPVAAAAAATTTE